MKGCTLKACRSLVEVWSLVSVLYHLWHNFWFGPRILLSSDFTPAPAVKSYETDPLFLFPGVMYLTAQDYVELKIHHSDAQLDVAEDLTFFGAVQLSCPKRRRRGATRGWRSWKRRPMLWRHLIARFPWSPWLTAPRTGTLTWIARIHSHTYINTATTTWCEAPAQLLFFSACWVFLCFRNPPNSDVDYRIFIARDHSCACVYTRGLHGHTDSESAQHVWLGRTHKLFLYSWRDSKLRPLDPRPTLYQLSHHVTNVHTEMFVSKCWFNTEGRPQIGWMSVLRELSLISWTFCVGKSALTHWTTGCRL